MNVLKIAALAAALAVAAPAFAQNAAEEAALRQNCTGDYMRLCSQYDPGSTEVDQCFKAKMNDLTPQCRTAIAAYTKKNPGGRTR